MMDTEDRPKDGDENDAASFHCWRHTHAHTEQKEHTATKTKSRGSTASERHVVNDTAEATWSYAESLEVPESEERAPTVPTAGSEKGMRQVGGEVPT